jgi:polysaccharide export outer membrane protein
MPGRKTIANLFKVAAAVAGLAASGCSFIAKDGPVNGSIQNQAAITAPNGSEAPKYVLVAASPSVIRSANGFTEGLAARFPKMARGSGPDVSIGKGDIVSVTVFEKEAGGLFLPKDAGARQGNFVQVPPQQVDERGQISVPYVPEPISVVGRTPRSVGQEIAQKLADRAIDPQVVVSVVEKRGDEVSVLGDVNTPAKFSLDPGGLSLLAAVARAGGPKNPTFEENVVIQRGDQIRKAWLASVVADPQQNVALRAGDVVVLEREQRVFMVLGASPTPGAIGGQNNRRFPFSSSKMSLSEALATAGGLDSLRADPGQVFVFRLEPRRVVEGSGADVNGLQGSFVPTVYSFDLSQGASFFLADAFDMRDKDVVFIADATATDLNKFIITALGLAEIGYYGAEISSLTK